VRQAVVYFESAVPQPTRAPETPYEIVTRGKEFLPRVLAVPRGSRVRFPNSDPILHNVFSVSGDNSFDLGLYRKGPGKDKRFDHPGVVRVFCNVHQAMVAYVLVLETPFSTSPDAAGAFALAGLPRGAGKLTVWHEQAEPWTMDLRLPAASPVVAKVEVTRPRIPPHLDKTGRSYSRAKRDKYGG
jgi:plastocyanin